MERRLQSPTPRANPMEERQSRLGADGGGSSLRGVEMFLGFVPRWFGQYIPLRGGGVTRHG
jgi:hypothetical protein